MPIIKDKKSLDIQSIKANVNPQALELIENYCQWAGIYDIGYFIEKAVNTLVLNDPDWLLHKEKEQSLEIEIKMESTSPLIPGMKKQ